MNIACPADLATTQSDEVDLIKHVTLESVDPLQTTHLMIWVHFNTAWVRGLSKQFTPHCVLSLMNVASGLAGGRAFRTFPSALVLHCVVVPML